MLSNKMTVSLMSLITILAFAFVVTPAMAGEFGVSLDKTDDVSTATDDLELEHPGDGMKLDAPPLRVEFAKAVVLAKESVQIITIDKDGMLLSLQKFPPAAETAANAGRTKSFMPVVEGDATTVKIFIAAGIASADPFNEDTSKKFEATIHLIGADDGAPTVHSIKRAVDDDHAFAKISPKTDPTIEVRITLSELPKEFTKDHISVTEADVTSVRQLLTESGTSLMDYLASDDAPDTLPRKRMMYDEDMSGVTVTANTNDDVYIAATTGSPATPVTLVGLNTASGEAVGTTIDAADLRARKVAARKKYGGIHRAINDAKILGTAHKYKEIPALTLVDGTTAVDATATNISDTESVAMNLDPKAADKEFGVNYILMQYMGQAIAMKTPGAPGTAVIKPTMPKLSDFGAVVLFTAAVRKYAVDFEKYRTYMNAKTLYEGYMEAVEKEKMKDADAREMAFKDPKNNYDPRAMNFTTGTDAKLYPYLVVITPKYANKNDVVVKVKEFEDRTRPTSMKYIPPSLESDYREDVDKLTIMVAEAKVGTPLGDGLEVVIPKEKRIPASGHLVLATNVAGSGIKKPAGSDKDEPKPAERTRAQLKYNVVELGLPNLETFLSNGGTIALFAPAGVYISEIMWGSDSSLSPNNNSQWIEISNSGAASVLTGDKTHKLVFYGLNETPASGAVDTVGTVGTGGFWRITGKGQSGRTGTGEQAADVVAVVPTLELISMQRMMNADGTPADGTLEGSWVQSKGPGVNFDLSQVGVRIGSPGAPIDAAKYPATPTPVTPAPKVPAAAAADVMITEIMVDTGNGRAPQWIELTYSGMAKATLDGWEMVIDNAIDADVLGGGNAITVSLGGVMVDVSTHAGNTGKGQSVLVTAWPATRKSANISNDRVINLATQLNQVSRYQLLSYSGFRITLVPPRTGATISSFGDIAGNLHEDWEIPMSEGTARSSIIRREMVAGAATMGTDAAGWMLADSTLGLIGQPSFYGNDEDQGTPGHDSGGPLPVELSHFRPARNKATGAAVITWSTQSELNNAGFFIKRSQQRDGEFKVINATMIPGAGTTSEKQFYTFTDTTAQPNVVYYYQIEDVSLDGNRQTLTHGIRLKGHIGAAGKATVTWGELKTSNE